MDKIKKLYFKRFGYHHNLNRHNTSFNNIDHNSNALSRQSNVPSSFTTRTTNHSSTPRVPAKPMAPTPSTHTVDFHPVANHPAARQPTSNHTRTSHTDKLVINLSKTPSPRNNYPFYKKAPIMPLPPNTPHRSIHNLNRTSSQQITNPGSR